MGYTPEAARNVLRVIEENGGDPVIIWKSLESGDREARSPFSVPDYGLV